MHCWESKIFIAIYQIRLSSFCQLLRRSNQESECTFLAENGFFFFSRSARIWVTMKWRHKQMLSLNQRHLKWIDLIDLSYSLEVFTILFLFTPLKAISLLRLWYECTCRNYVSSHIFYSRPLENAVYVLDITYKVKMQPRDLIPNSLHLNCFKI